jgi:hypothetical protein
MIKNNNFNYTAWINYKKHTDRYDRLPDFIIDKLTSYIFFEKFQSLIKLLDYGSGDLSLFYPLYTRLENRIKNIEFTLVDNSVEVKNNININYPYFYNNFIFDDIIHYNNNVAQSTISLALLSHTLYHIEHSKWDKLILEIVQKLEKYGILIIIMRDRESQWWRTFDKYFEDEKIKKLTSHIFANDLIRNLEKNDILFKQSKFNYQFIADSDSQIINACKFLYRLEDNLPNEVEFFDKIIKDIKKFKTSSNYKFDFIDTIVIIEK